MAININRTSIDTCMWHIKRYMMQTYGCDVADREFAPLEWYIETGRASTDFLRKLISAKPYMVARRLHKGGSDCEAIKRVAQYIGA